MEALLFCTLPRCLPWNDGNLLSDAAAPGQAREACCSSPIDNTKGVDDKTVRWLQEAIVEEAVMDDSQLGYVKQAAAAAGLDWCLVLDQQLTGAKQQKCIMTVEEFCARGKALVAWRSGRRPETAARRRRQRRPPQCWPRSTRSSAPCSTSQDLPVPACAGLGRAGPAMMARGPPVPCHVCATPSLHQPP